MQNMIIKTDGKTVSIHNFTIKNEKEIIIFPEAIKLQNKTLSKLKNIIDEAIKLMSNKFTYTEDDMILKEVPSWTEEIILISEPGNIYSICNSNLDAFELSQESELDMKMLLLVLKNYLKGI